MMAKQYTTLPIPTHIFKDRQLGTLEALVHYLRTHLNLSNIAIAKLLNRDPRTTWTAYHKAQQKKRNSP